MPTMTGSIATGRQADRQGTGEVVENLHLIHRHGSSHWEWPGFLKPQTPSAFLLPKSPHLLILSKQFHQLGVSIQIYQPMAAILIKTTAVTNSMGSLCNNSKLHSRVFLSMKFLLQGENINIYMR